jgi:hypothetical protein
VRGRTSAGPASYSRGCSLARPRARANGKRLDQLPFSAADRKKLIAALDTGMSWRAVSAATGIPFSTVQKHARLLGYSPPGRERENRDGR